MCSIFSISISFAYTTFAPLQAQNVAEMPPNCWRFLLAASSWAVSSAVVRQAVPPRCPRGSHRDSRSTRVERREGGSGGSVVAPRRTRGRQTLDGPFSAVAKPIFSTKYSVCSVFRNLQEFHTLAPRLWAGIMFR